jgi:cell division septation protein DedD
MAKQAIIRWAVLLGTGMALAGCEEGQQPLGFLKKSEPGAEAAAPRAKGGTVERDVEAPEVFAVDGDGLWDGRPSLGGVWIAHPDVKDPERVIIRNTTNGKSVIGALFRRERNNPGPKLQVSSDAASTLGMLAGAPVKLSVVALRREEVPVEGTEAIADDAAGAIAAEKIEAKPIDEITSNAANAIAAAGAKPATPPASATPAVAPPVKPEAKPAVAAKPAAGFKPYVQIGIFSQEANAKRAAEQLSKAGVAQSIRKEESQGKAFWRVLAGPAASAAERDAITTKIKGLGYADAYAVSN